MAEPPFLSVRSTNVHVMIVFFAAWAAAADKADAQAAMLKAAL
jgi:hypothetical protein